LLFFSGALIFTISCQDKLGRNVGLAFVLAIIFSSWYSGILGGVISTILSTLAVDYLILNPAHAFNPATFENVFILGVFSIASLSVSQIVSKVKATEERFRYALETASDGFWDWNIKTGKVYFSPKWISSLGYRPGEVAFRVESWRHLIHPDDRLRTSETVQAHFAGRMPIYECENRLLMKSGAWRWNLDRGKVVAWDRKGRPLRMVGVDIDISERKGAEIDRAARTEAEATNRIKDEFIAMVSHELRNPLSAITMAADLLSVPNLDPDNIEFAAQSIKRSAKFQLMLVNDLLEWSRLKCGKFTLGRQMTPLGPLVESAWEVVMHTAQQKRIHLELYLEPKDLQILVDPDRLTQVLWNLFTNAVKFTPEGGVVSVAGRRDRNSLRLSVKDNGRGISAECLPHLFESHWQVQEKDASQHHGLGLGLWIAREIVERHGGSIHAESDGPGKGSTFVVNLKECF
jgi:PAS domain S-box-containing protein